MKYLKYLLYILEHKKNVFIECWNEGLYKQAFTHDLSKFNPLEFFAYADYDFQNKENNTEEIKQKFEKAWRHHYLNNRHHWQYWCYVEGKDSTIDFTDNPMDMPLRYIREMVCDLRAMGKKKGNTAEWYYFQNYNKMKLSRDTRWYLEGMLEVYYPNCSQCDEIYYKTIEETVKYCLEIEKRDNKENWFLRKEFKKYYMDKYGIDILKILGVE